MSAHRMRLEMLGLVRDGPGGIELTENGRVAALGKAAAPKLAVPPAKSSLPEKRSSQYGKYGRSLGIVGAKFSRRDQRKD